MVLGIENELGAEWHVDGHTMTLVLSGDDIQIALYCPARKERGGKCYDERLNTCVVSYFLELYGLECNKGVAQIEPHMEIVWCLIGDPYDLDSSQVWIMPKEDTAFGSWLAEREVREIQDGSGRIGDD
jgi:hypothetical protein